MQSVSVTSNWPNLQVGHLFRRAWSTFKLNIWISLGMFILYSVLTNLGSGSEFSKNGSGFSIILDIVVMLITGPLMAGTYYAFLRMLRGEKVEFASMFDGFKVFGKALGAFWLMVLAIIVGFILLIVPGVIISLGLLPVMFLVLDEKLGIVDTLKRAWELTKGHKGNLFVLMLAVIGFNILGLLALIIGVFVTATVTIFIFAAAYDELVGSNPPAISRETPPEAIPIV